MRKVRTRLLLFTVAIILIPCFVYADSTSSQLFYSYNDSEDAKVVVQTIKRKNYLFLPSEADIAAFTLNTDDADAAAYLSAPGNGDAKAILDLNEADWTGNSCTIQVMLTDQKGKSLADTFELCIMKGNNIGSVYFRSDDTRNHGRSWVDASKDNRGSGRAAVTNASGEIIYNGLISDIHARGNSSFKDPKKGYQIKLDKKTALISGTQKAKKWILLAQYKDPLRMNDKILKDIDSVVASSEGRFSPKEEFVNLYYDGEYRGVYLLSEKNEVGKGRIDITDMEDAYKEADESYGDNVVIRSAMNDYGNTFYYQEGLADCKTKGGYLIEMNSSTGDELNWFQWSNGSDRRAMNIKSPELGSKEDVRYISEYFQEFCTAVCATEQGKHTGYNTKTGKYYYDYCDLNSLADAYLIQTIASNLDGFKRSLYFFKDTDEIMYAGPVWDMDLSFGIGWTSEIAPGEDYIAKALLAQELIKIPSFRERIKERYFEKYEPILSVLLQDREEPASLLSYGDRIRADIVMDWVLWPDKYKVGSGSVKWDDRTSFDTILDNRYEWIKAHKNYLDSYFENMEPDNAAESSGGSGFVGGGGGGGAAANPDQVAANNVEAIINALPDDITFSDMKAVETAREEYEALTDNQKALMDRDILLKLEAAEAFLKSAVSVQAVEDAIDALPESYSVTTADKVSIEAVRVLYEDLSEIEKAFVSADRKAKLEADLSAIAKAELKEASYINKAVVKALDIKTASDLGAITVTLGPKVKKISKNAFKASRVKTIIVKSKKMTTKKVKGSLKESKVRTIKVQVSGSKIINRKYINKYKKAFVKKNAGKRVSVK